MVPESLLVPDAGPDPVEVLSDLLADVPGIEAAFLFGSVVKGTRRPDSDVDLFVVGEDVDPVALGGAVLEASTTLGCEVDLKHYTRTRLQGALRERGTSYLRRVLDGPKRWLIGFPEMLTPS